MRYKMYSISLFVYCYRQTILNSQPEADLKMAALKSKGENLYTKLDESRKESIQQTLRDVQEKLRILMEIAKEHRKQAELQDSLSKELQTFQSEEKKIQSWVEELKQELVSLGKSTHGTQEQIEERLNKAQVSTRDTEYVSVKLFRDETQ